MSLWLRLLALPALWKRLTGTYQQARTGIHQASHAVHQVMERHVQSTFEKAQLGDREAMYEMGERFYEGRGVPQDYPQAAAWFRLAADLGHTTAQTNLGMMLWIGRGCSRDREAARHWVEVAARQRDETAVELLKKMRSGRR